MRRVGDRRWLVGIVMLIAVLVFTRAFYASEAARHQQQERAVQRQVVGLLGNAVHDVLTRQRALVRVIEAAGPPKHVQWPALANIVTSQPAATSAGFIVPVKESDRLSFERRTGLDLVESPQGGELQSDLRRGLHMVVVDSITKSHVKPLLGLDVAANALRRRLLLEAASTRRQVASQPVEFLGRAAGTFGVVVYEPVFTARGRVEGWVAASYATKQLAATITSQMRGVAVTVRDGRATLLRGRGSAGPSQASSDPGTVQVAGRHWQVWAAAPGSGISDVPWLVLGFGLALTAMVTLILHQSATREGYAARRLAEHDADEAALSRVATLVAQGAQPGAVFASVAEEVGRLLRSRTAAVSRFDAKASCGVVIGSWTPDGQSLAGIEFALDGMTASAAVFRTGRPARTGGAYLSQADPISEVMTRLESGGGVAAPIVVAGELWGSLGAAYAAKSAPPGAEERLERFGRLVGLAVSNADALERLDRQASTDGLTGLTNRRVFDERLRSEVARVRRHDRPLSLALFDLDHFKQINDRSGHQAGDRALVSFAGALADGARHGDVAARLGGEEFAWLMPESDLEGAQSAAERLRAVIAAMALDGICQMTVSAGVVTADELSTADSLLSSADSALYAAKSGGRNRVVARRSDSVAGAPAR